MHKDELRRSDLLSEIVLLGSGAAILIALVLAMGAAVSSAAALR